MKKGLCFVFVSILSSLLLLPGMAAPACAASAQASISTIHVTSTVMSPVNGRRAWHPRRWWPVGHWYYGAPQINNQYLTGNSHSGETIRSVGRNQVNTGNAGWNRHYLQDSSVNSGNQMINQREPSGYRINNQYFHGNSHTRNTYFFQGNSQGNSGNEGVNDGIIRDYSNNGGNQLRN